MAQHYDYQLKVDSKTTKPCYHARIAGVFTVLSFGRSKWIIDRRCSVNRLFRTEFPAQVWELTKSLDTANEEATNELSLVSDWFARAGCRPLEERVNTCTSQV